MIQTRTCKQCGVGFNGGPRAYYCPECRVERTREANRQHRARLKKVLPEKLEVMMSVKDAVKNIQ